MPENFLIVVLILLSPILGPLTVILIARFLRGLAWMLDQMFD